MVYYTISYKKSCEFRIENDNFSFLRFSPFVPPPIVADFSQYRDLKYNGQGEKNGSPLLRPFFKSRYDPKQLVSHLSIIDGGI
jgi:hypothetical protein